MELHGCNGCGSSAVEALLEMAGVAYRRNVFDWDDRDAWERLRKIQPLAQVPTLVLDDGTVLTESAAIVLWIAEQHSGAGLMPSDPVMRSELEAKFRKLGKTPTMQSNRPNETEMRPVD